MTCSKIDSTPIKVTLVCGLLGSGKTSTLQHLISQKPADEHWAVLINDFGLASIDSSLLKQQDVSLFEVQGGCICCSAQRPLAQALAQISQLDNLDHLLIEPSGLAHPAQIIDTLKKTATHRPLHLESTLCVLDLNRFSPAVYQKSALLRDFIQLADVLLLTRCDQLAPNALAELTDFLSQKMLGKPHIQAASFGKTPLSTLKLKAQRPPFLLLQAKNTAQQAGLVEAFESQLPKVKQSQILRSNTQAISWIFQPDLLFMRPKIKTFFADPPLGLIRAKGLLRTGNNWQLINWVNGELTFSDQAWRQDNRIEMLFEHPIALTELEQAWVQTIHTQS
ncbi:GTP-binding protein [Thiomicrospira microaerophila]|uniref:CobW family GTP-binding protein n=1 Tax=Thiomicrospira microaerophila TaxID=406020 RepID=UPI00200CC9C5|nr:CobW family GTP-binding protein [Thiomicrospira microaerophila]UQB41721.1 GTP-binding protein [Thiomicrospira microaerophila]